MIEYHELLVARIRSVRSIEYPVIRQSHKDEGFGKRPTHRSWSQGELARWSYLAE
jgi:hypothetical protein